MSLRNPPSPPRGNEYNHGNFVSSFASNIVSGTTAVNPTYIITTPAIGQSGSTMAIAYPQQNPIGVPDTMPSRNTPRGLEASRISLPFIAYLL